jgi:hypothetical protein
MSLVWGNPREHAEAFEAAMTEYREQHPDDLRPFHELERELQSLILARQVEIYRSLIVA